MHINSQANASRIQQLKEVAEAYFDSLRNGRFETIPYHENAALRAPLTPGGANVPLQGKQELFNKWWLPLEPALKDVTITTLGHYLHEDLTGIITEAEIILAAPSARLRVADRFTIDEDGKITEQENHFNPREVTG